ncbi:hypothetical protein H4R18_005680 [Coemansia javaensis]|uniref:SDE2-like domain-containing protein n=1 Tax=Coemansia javaensis TaxID=2761396 RepID=A0A9W8LDW9_9FUNG|nr:hypothetical protein H4R18_005680 [Coemansia javaensis]
MLVLLDVPGRRAEAFDVCAAAPLADLLAQARARLGGGVPWDSVYVAGRGGLSAEETLAASSRPWLALRGRLAGGKGGFGSTLRSQGSRMSQSRRNDYDDCRDLYGRRLRTLKEAKTIADRVELEERARAEAAERRRKKIADGLQDRPAPKRLFDDAEYERSCEDVVGATRRATRRALRGAARRRSESPPPPPPPAAEPLVPLGDAGGDSSSASSDDDSSGRQAEPSSE